MNDRRSTDELAREFKIAIFDEIDKRIDAAEEAGDGAKVEKLQN